MDTRRTRLRSTAGAADRPSMREDGRRRSGLVSKLPLLRFSPTQPGARKPCRIRVRCPPRRSGLPPAATIECTRLQEIGRRRRAPKVRSPFPQLPTKPLHFAVDRLECPDELCSSRRTGRSVRRRQHPGRPAGALHARQQEGESGRARWFSISAVSDTKLTFTVHDVSSAQPAAVLSAHTFDASRGASTTAKSMLKSAAGAIQEVRI